MPGQTQANDRWELLKLRMQAAAKLALGRNRNRQSGCAIVTVHVVVSHSGDPLLWVVPDAKLVEPTEGMNSQRAEEILQSLAG